MTSREPGAKRPDGAYPIDQREGYAKTRRTRRDARERGADVEPPHEAAMDELLNRVHRLGRGPQREK